MPEYVIPGLFSLGAALVGVLFTWIIQSFLRNKEEIQRHEDKLRDTYIDLKLKARGYFSPCGNVPLQSEMELFHV